MNNKLKSHDILFITLDTLRYDIAIDCWQKKLTPNLEKLLGSPWEKRHTPGNFTYAAHHSFFAGFLPTPADSKADQTRLMAVDFAGSETIGPKTATFKTSNIVDGFKEHGYHTICVGGVGFFNKKTALSQVLPKYFDESHWTEALGVTSPHSTENQFNLAAERLGILDLDQASFMFINVSAIHQPNYFYSSSNENNDTTETHAAALQYVDKCLPTLTQAYQIRKRPVFYIICSDHGTAYGEDGFLGHRISHECVWTVPYAHGTLE